MGQNREERRVIFFLLSVVISSAQIYSTGHFLLYLLFLFPFTFSLTPLLHSSSIPISKAVGVQWSFHLSSSCIPSQDS